MSSKHDIYPSRLITYTNIHLRPSHRNSPSTPSIPPLPRPNPQRAPDPDTHAHSPETALVTLLSEAENLLFQITHRSPPRGPLVHIRVHQAPYRSAQCGDHGNDTPIGAEILNAPYYTDDEGGETKERAVSRSDKGRDEPETFGVILDEACCLEDGAQGENRRRG